MKILIVDDSRVMRSLVTRALQAAGFTDLSEAICGAEALHKVRAERFDFVLTDWNMPEMDGLQFLKAVNAEKIDVPVAFVTSECTDGMLNQAREAGAQFIVNKPFTPDVLAAALNGALEKLAKKAA